MNSMRGTEIASPYCASLEGKVGESVSCAIYENRPSPCRKFAASYENGLENLDCNRARAGKGLAALTLAQWQV
jgi:Fe-S-cluster containining protein